MGVVTSCCNDQRAERAQARAKQQEEWGLLKQQEWKKSQQKVHQLQTQLQKISEEKHKITQKNTQLQLKSAHQSAKAQNDAVQKRQLDKLVSNLTRQKQEIQQQYERKLSEYQAGKSKMKSEIQQLQQNISLLQSEKMQQETLASQSVAKIQSQFANKHYLFQQHKKVLQSQFGRQKLQIEQNLRKLTEKCGQLEQALALQQRQVQQLKKKHRESSVRHQEAQKISSLKNKQLQIALSDQQNIFQQKQKLHRISSTRHKEDKNTIRFGYLMQGTVFQNNQKQKQYLITVLENHTRRRIVSTKCLYFFDPLNKTNFHNYVDGKQNVLLVIKLSSGVIIAGFSQGAFIARQPLQKDGLLVSVTYEKAFKLRQTNRRAISYDEFYLIFGNAELRLRSGQGRIFSNFGLTNSFYDHQGCKIMGFWGSAEREQDFHSYEIYQLAFDSE